MQAAAHPVPTLQAAREYQYARRVWHRPSDGGAYVLCRGLPLPDAGALAWLWLGSGWEGTPWNGLQMRREAGLYTGLCCGLQTSPC